MMTDRTDHNDHNGHNDSPENDLWQSHSEKFLEMAFRSDRREILHHPDGKGHKTGVCGDEISFYIMVKDHCIHHMAYDIHGCMHTNACANAIIEQAEGKTIEQAWTIDPESVARYLETLPPDHFHCAELAVGAFYLALANLRDNQKSPWKKCYR